MQEADGARFALQVREGREGGANIDTSVCAERLFKLCEFHRMLPAHFVADRDIVVDRDEFLGLRVAAPRFHR